MYFPFYPFSFIYNEFTEYDCYDHFFFFLVFYEL